MSNAEVKEGQYHWRPGHAAGFLAHPLEKEERGFIPFTLSSGAAINTLSMPQCL